MKPLPIRFWTWMLERYPPFLLIVHSMVYYASIWVTSIIADGTRPFLLSRDLLGCLSLFLFPMVLRIMDEHKDYDQDLRLYPDRPVQRGLISLSELRGIAYFAVAVQLGFCLWADRGVGDCTALWIMTMLYALLMGKEFFCGEWLEKRMIVYALSHQAITPISMIWVAAAYSAQHPLPDEVWGLAIIGLFGSFTYELSRKLKAPTDEKPEIASYTQSLGATTAPLLTAFLLIGQSAFLVWWLSPFSRTIVKGVDQITNTLAPDGTALVIHVAVTGLCALPFFLFVRSPSTKGAKMLEGMSALMTLWTYGLLLYLCWTF
ncbi:MAG: hypothetical protein VX278_22235 [Myxococcota bacterium]|nr:hypothetical protein [Myxococcota bacterium]